MTSSDIFPGRLIPPGEELSLPTPPGLARRFWSRHPRLTDAGIAAVYLVPVLLGLIVTAGVTSMTPSPGAADLVVRFAVVITVAVALLFRRQVPRTVLMVSWAGLFVSYPGFGPADALPVLLGLYALAVYRSAGSAWIGLAASVIVGFLAAAGRMVGSPLAASAVDAAWITMGSQYAVVMLAATLVGVNLGDRKRYVGALLNLAAQLAAERDRQAGLARVAERARIAREMHDIVAHSLSVMVALADGSAALVDTDPERSRAAMRQVAGTGRSSLVEMRRLLGVLADGQDIAMTPQPGIGQLAELVETFRTAGLPTRLEVQGRSPENAGMQLTVYRIVQESLTNALRYARQPNRVTVRLRLTAGSADILVDDDGTGPPTGRDAAGRVESGPAASHGSGRGIIGLQERAALYGGALQAGPGPHGGWRVHATMTLPEETPQ